MKRPWPKLIGAKIDPIWESGWINCGDRACPLFRALSKHSTKCPIGAGFGFKSAVLATAPVGGELPGGTG